MKAKKIKENAKKIKPRIIIYALAIIIVLWIIIGAVLVYGFNSGDKFTKLTEKFIPYPAAIINYTHFITVNEISNDLDSVKRFYENQDFSKIGMRVDFSTSDGQKRLMIRERQLVDKLIEDKAIEILARKNGIIISENTVDQNVARKLEEYGSQNEVQSNLAKLYGWDLSDFKEKVVKPSMYKEQLEKLVMDQNKDEFSKSAHEKIIQAQNELNQKADFAAVAQKYSDGLSAGQGGELGWFTKDQLAPEVSDAAFALGVNKRSDVIESSLGYHIIEVEDKKADNGEDMVKLRQIFARKKMFVDWLEEQMKSLKIDVPLKDYYWDTNEIMVDYRKAEMKSFEKNLRDNVQGDASVMF